MSPRKRCRPTPAVSSTTAPGVAQCCKPSPGTAVCSVHTAACRVRRSSSNVTAADVRRSGEPRDPIVRAMCGVILRRPAQYTPVDGAARRQVELQMHSAADDVNSASSNTSPNPVSARSTHPFWEVFARTALDTFASPPGLAAVSQREGDTEDSCRDSRTAKAFFSRPMCCAHVLANPVSTAREPRPVLEPPASLRPDSNGGSAPPVAHCDKVGHRK